MEDSVKEEFSNRTRIGRIWILFGKSLRNRLGERHLIPVALSLFAVIFIHRHSFRKFCQSLSTATAKLFTKFAIIFCAALVLFCSAKKVYAVPICDRNFNAAWYNIDISRADCELYEYYSIGVPYSGRAYIYFNEGDNIEWIYSTLENQYAYLDDTLYRILGGNYSFGPMYYPPRHGFRHYACAPNPDTEIILLGNRPAAAFNANVETAQISDVFTFSTRQNDDLLRDSYHSRSDILGYPAIRERFDVGVKAVPEPSTLMLFGMAAFLILRTKRSGGLRTQKN
jgi:hypothetical protein